MSFFFVWNRLDVSSGVPTSLPGPNTLTDTLTSRWTVKGSEHTSWEGEREKTRDRSDDSDDQIKGDDL